MLLGNRIQPFRKEKNIFGINIHVILEIACAIRSQEPLSEQGLTLLAAIPIKRQRINSVITGTVFFSVLPDPGLLGERVGSQQNAGKLMMQFSQ